MFVDFNGLGDNSKVWVYQADRFLTSSEEEIVIDRLTAFCHQWLAHGQPLKTSFKIEHHYFIILAVDEASAHASGCSVDGSVHMLKELQRETRIDFFDRNRLAFFIDHEVKTYSTGDVKKFLSTGELDAKSLMFNNTVTTKEELKTQWLVPAGKSWVAKYLPKTVVVS